MKRLLLAICIIVAVFYFIQPPQVSRDDMPRMYTQVERNVDAKEAGLSLLDRGKRFMHFKEAVQTAIAMRVPAEKYVPLSDIAPSFQEAMVATEDKRFYTHMGFDVYGIARAMYVNILAGETMEGGSTITQQLVKNLFLSSDRVWSRKVEEVALSLAMEHYYTKEQILEMYVNSIYYGNTYYGILAASEGYFHKKPEYLTLAESALLAGLVQAPTFYNPVVNPEAARIKRMHVLERMLDQHYITEKQKKEAEEAPLLPQK